MIEKTEHLKRRDFTFSPSKYKSNLDYPDQFIRIENGIAEIGLDRDHKIKIDSELARKILNVFRMRDLEGDKSLDNIKSSWIRRLTLLSNCHRSMLYLFGFKLQELVDRDMCSEIINEYFLEAEKSYKVEHQGIEKKISEISKHTSNPFPMSLNFYAEESDSGYTSTHSVTILGILASGKPLCFHKNGIGDGVKVELTTLDKIIEYRCKGYKFTLHTKEEVDQLLNKFRLDEAQKHAK